jgi:hypothetical protein
MQHAKSNGHILSGLVEVLIGGSVLSGILAVTLLLSAAIMPNVSHQLAQMTDRAGAFTGR